jgi:hypothetical protein
MLTFSAGGATGLDFPDMVLSYSVEVESLSYIIGAHCCKNVKLVIREVSWCQSIWRFRLTTVNILLVGENEKDNVAHFAVLDDTAKFGFGFLHASAVA